MTHHEVNTSTLKASTVGVEVTGALMKNAQANGEDLTALKRLTLTMRARMYVRIDGPLQQCISLMGGLVGSMAAPAGQKIFLAPEHGVVVDAGEIIAMVIAAVPGK